MGNANRTPLTDTKLINGQHLTEEECFKEHENLIWYVVHRFKRVLRETSTDQDDLFSEGTIGLIRAYREFDESKGYKFSTYAVPKILGAISNFVRDYAYTIKTPRDQDNIIHASFHFKMSEKGELKDMFGQEDNYTMIYLNERLKQMPARSRDIIKLSLQGYTQREIAQQHGISQVQVSRLIKKEVAV